MGCGNAQSKIKSGRRVTYLPIAGVGGARPGLGGYVVRLALGTAGAPVVSAVVTLHRPTAAAAVPWLRPLKPVTCVQCENDNKLTVLRCLPHLQNQKPRLFHSQFQDNSVFAVQFVVTGENKIKNRSRLRATG